MLHLAHVSDLLPTNRSRKCLQILRILLRAADFVIYSSYSSMTLFSSGDFRDFVVVVVAPSAGDKIKRDIS